MKSKSLTEHIHPQISRLEDELHTKQIQLNFLMRFTQAINLNKTRNELFKMYSDFLTMELGMHRLVMLFKEPNGWKCVREVDYVVTNLGELVRELTKKYDDFSSVGELAPAFLKPFELIVPVFHKEDPLAYVLVGKIDQADDTYDRYKFMITLSNIVAVAVENKRLFSMHLEKETYKKELEVAQRVQQMLIPSELPDDSNFEVSAIYRPHSDIGGDYFDFYRSEDGSLLICLADVSGKGIPAAILMANFQATMRSLVKIYSDLDDLVRQINETLVGITKSERIVTFFVLKFDPQTREITYVNAGHNPPIFVNGKDQQFLNVGCTILGAVDDLDHIEVGTIEVNDDEALIMMYTDGLTDLRNARGEYFDEDCLQAFVGEHHGRSAEDFNKYLLEEMESFKGKQAYPDDIAVVSFKIRVRT